LHARNEEHERQKAQENAGMLNQDPVWYKDAVFYELHVRAFYDSNDDGVGDFAGLIEQLDYLE
jgi:maltose alpha-D-glucosyltransferase / alpha-amylase